MLKTCIVWHSLLASVLRATTACTFTTSGRHRYFQKRSEPVVLCKCSLPNVLRATTASTFSALQLIKVLRSRSALYTFTSKCASRHNGVIFIFHLANWLRTAALASLLFEPPETKKNRTTECFATCLPFRAPASSPLLIFSTSSLLPSFFAFPSVHIVGSLAYKLPSIITRWCPNLESISWLKTV